MQLNQGLGGIAIATTISTLIAQPVWAAPTEVTAVRLNRNANGVELILDTQGTTRPQVFTVNKGNSAVADITNTRLRLPNGNSFRQTKPAPGITSVVVNQLDTNTIRVVVSGTTKAPTGQVLRRNGPVVLGFKQAPDNEANSAPPTLRRAVAPPVGDIAVAPVDAPPDAVDLGISERVSKLVLREAPTREVLTLLARAADLNLAFAADTQSKDSQAQNSQDAATSEEPKISLDIENEPVQDVFNYVLQLSGLEANRVGRTIFVGPRLPDTARNLVTRSFRLNQVPAESAGNYLAAQGAELQLPRDVLRIETVGEGEREREIETRTPEILRVKAEAENGPLLLKGLSVITDTRLNSVTLVGTPRTVEIASTFLTQLDLRRRQVAVNVKIIDINLLNTKELNASFSFGAGRSFFTIDNGAAVFNYGGFNPPTAGTVEGALDPRVVPIPENLRDPANESGPFLRSPRPPFGTSDDFLQPGITNIEPPTAENPFETLTYGLPSLFRYPLRLLSLLRAQIVSGDAKILTDPTLIVQEGQKSKVELGQEVFAGFRTVQDATEGIATVTREPIIKNAGVTLEIQLDRVDDNGFVTLSVLPTVSAPTGSTRTDDGVITLLSQRKLQSGQIRLRDNQTLVLTGVIQDSDRTTVSKVPILGDIPILGRLFRSTTKEKQRQEVVMLLTPQILDDSSQSSFGYKYKPSPEAERMLNPPDQ